MVSRRIVAEVLCAAALVGCAPSTKFIMGSDQSAVQLRSYQQRAFDTADKTQTLRSVISTLQDLSFVVDKADLDLGTVSATKLSGYQLRMTVTVRPRGTSQMLVRANAQYMDKAVEDPKPYQDFFTALEKSMFLTAQQVD
jgi:hypothetical protein